MFIIMPQSKKIKEGLDKAQEAAKSGDPNKITVSDKTPQKQDVEVQQKQRLKEYFSSDEISVKFGGAENKGKKPSVEQIKTYIDQNSPKIEFNSLTGRVEATVPKAYKDNDLVKEITDEKVLEYLSKNYQNDPDVKYTNPFEPESENKVSTSEYVNLLNDALRNRVSVVNTERRFKGWLKKNYGGTEEKDKLIDELTYQDIITAMTSATGENAGDNSLLAIPQWVIDKNPWMKNLEGFDAEHNTITRKSALSNIWDAGKLYDAHVDQIKEDPNADNLPDWTGISEAAALKEEVLKAFENIENLSPEEIARTYAFATFLEGNDINVDPLRSTVNSLTSLLGGVVHQGADKRIAGIADFIGNIIPGLSYAVTHGGNMEGYESDTPFTDFANSDDNLMNQVVMQKLKNDYLLFDNTSFVNTGETIGSIGTDIVLTKLASDYLVKPFIEEVSGAVEYKAVTKVLDDALTRESTSASLMTEAQAQQAAITIEDAARASGSTIANPATRITYQTAIDFASSKFIDYFGSSEAVLSTMSGAQLAKVVNGVYAATRLTQGVTAAMGIASSVAIAAIIYNPETTMRVLTSEATDAEAKEWIKSMITTAAFTGTGYAVGYSENMARLKSAAFPNGFFNEAKSNGRKPAGKASAFMTAADTKLSEAWLKFRSKINQMWAKAAQSTHAPASIKNANTSASEAISINKFLNEVKKNVAKMDTSQVFNPNISLAVNGSQIGADFVSGDFGTVDAAVNPELVPGNLKDPITGQLTEYNIGTVTYAAVNNAALAVYDAKRAAGQLMSELLNENLNPNFTSAVREFEASDLRLAKLESEAGLITEKEYKNNLKIFEKSNGQYTNFHTKAVNDYANYSYQLKLLDERGVSKTTETYKLNLEQKQKAYDSLPVEYAMEIALEIDNAWIPSIWAKQSALTQYAVYELHLESESLITGLRESGKFGPNGEMYITRVVQNKPNRSGVKFVASEYSVDRTVELNYEVEYVKPDELTPLDLGLATKIQEYATAYAGKLMMKANRMHGGLAGTEVVSGQKTEALRKVKHYKGKIANRGRSIMKALAEETEDTNFFLQPHYKVSEVGKRVISELINIDTIEFSDIKDVRTIMQKNNIPLAGSIIDEESFNEFYDNAPSNVQSIIRTNFGINGKPSYFEWTDMANGAPSMFSIYKEDIDRAYASSSDSVKQSEELAEQRNLIEKTLDSYHMNVMYNEDMVEIAEIGIGSYEKIYKFIDESITDSIFGALEDKELSMAIDGLSEINGWKTSGIAKDIRTQWCVLDELMYGEGKDVFNGLCEHLARKIVDHEVELSEKSFDNKSELKLLEKKLTKVVTSLIKGRFQDRYAECTRTLRRIDGDHSVDSGHIYEAVQELEDQIKTYKTDSNDQYVETLNDRGETTIVKVPSELGKMMNTRMTRLPVSWCAQFLGSISRLYQILNTSVNPKSAMKQLSSDSIQAFVTSGAGPFSISSNQKYLAQTFGDQIATELYRASLSGDADAQSEYNKIVDISERQGISFGEAAIVYTESKTEAVLPFTTTSEEERRRIGMDRTSSSDTNEPGKQTDKRMRKINERINDAASAISEKLGIDAREMYTRKTAFWTTFKNSMNQGYTYQQSRELALYSLRNSTTDFEQFNTVLTFLRQYVPYLNSGVSGAKSFWKMFEMDPSGFLARFNSGIVFPFLFCLASIMANEETRQRYENMTDDEKSNSIILAINGELHTIQVGEEIGKILDPIRHTAEKLYNTNKASWWGLMANDAVGFLPAGDLQGFFDVDMQNSKYYNYEAIDYFAEGARRLAASLSNPVIKTGYALKTGKDMYYGTNLRSIEYTFDADGNAIVQSKSQHAFSNLVAKYSGCDAKMFAAVVAGLFSSNGQDILDTITSTVEAIIPGGEQGNIFAAADALKKDITAPYKADEYNSDSLQFYNAIQELEENKLAITNTKKYQELNKSIESDWDRESRRKKIANRNSEFIEPFQQRVKALVENYKQRGLSLTSYQFNQIVGMLVFEDAVNADFATTKINPNDTANRALALQTAYNLGITEDPSETEKTPNYLGYMYRAKDGTTKIKMWTPYQQELLRDYYYNQSSKHAYNLRTILDNGGDKSIKKLYKKANEEITKIYNREKQDQKYYTEEKDAIRKEHNMAAALTIYDYINTYGADQILNNDDNIQLLKDYFFVPNSWETVKGRHISTENGKVDLKAAFIESYLKNIFGVK